MQLRNASLALIYLVSACTTANAQDSAKPKKGDWVQFKETVGKMEFTRKTTVLAADEKNITIKRETVESGTTIQDTEAQASIAEVTDPLQFFRKRKAKVEKVESGKESIEVAGQKLTCQWTSYDISIRATTFSVKIWLCPEVPLGGLVRMQIKEDAISLELTGFGRR